MRFLHKDTEKEESFPDFDYFLYSALAHDMQSRIQKGHTLACEEVLEKYRKEKPEENYADGEEHHRKVQEEFEIWISMNTDTDLDLICQCEQLMVYFLFTYFCGAVYDGEAEAKVRMAAGSVAIIWELLVGRWLQNGKTLKFSDLVEIVYRYSRELEHSDLNLEKMEQYNRK